MFLEASVTFFWKCYWRSINLVNYPTGKHYQIGTPWNHCTVAKQFTTFLHCVLQESWSRIENAMKVCALVQCMCNVQCNSPRDIIKALEDSSALWCGGIISPHCTIGSNWFGLKFEEKKESMLGFFNLNQYFVLIVFFNVFSLYSSYSKSEFSDIVLCSIPRYLTPPGDPIPSIRTIQSTYSTTVLHPSEMTFMRQGITE